MMTITAAKASARILKTFLGEHGVDLPHGVCLEAVARQAHYKNWATYLVDANATEALVKTSEQVQGWPKYVFFFDESEETNYGEALFVLPRGASLDDTERCDSWGPFLTHGAKQLPEDFELSDQTVASKVYSTAPSVDKYGLPHYADEDKAPAFFREDLQCAALTHVEVDFTDTGDDSASRYWFEAYVHPDVARGIEALFPQPAPVSQAAPAETVETRAYSIVFKRVFASVGAETVESIMCFLQSRSSTNYMAEPWLRTQFNGDVTLHSHYAGYTCKKLFETLRKAAKVEYENLVLAEVKR